MRKNMLKLEGSQTKTLLGLFIFLNCIELELCLRGYGGLV
jgi:hypothetical protein